MSVIVLEGPEGVGKTTLARNVIDYALTHKTHKHVAYHHHVAGDSVAMVLNVEMLMYTGSRQVSVLHIVDRWWLSEFVYSKLLPRKSTLDCTMAQAQEKWGDPILEAGGKLIILDGVHPTVLAERRKDDDLPVDPKDEVCEYAQAPTGWIRSRANLVFSDVAKWLLDEKALFHMEGPRANIRPLHIPEGE